MSRPRFSRTRSADAGSEATRRRSRRSRRRCGRRSRAWNRARRGRIRRRRHSSDRYRRTLQSASSSRTAFDDDAAAQVSLRCVHRNRRGTVPEPTGVRIDDIEMVDGGCLGQAYLTVDENDLGVAAEHFRILSLGTGWSGGLLQGPDRGARSRIQRRQDRRHRTAGQLCGFPRDGVLLKCPHPEHTGNDQHRHGSKRCDEHPRPAPSRTGFRESRARRRVSVVRCADGRRLVDNRCHIAAGRRLRRPQRECIGEGGREILTDGCTAPRSADETRWQPVHTGPIADRPVVPASAPATRRRQCRRSGRSR